MKNLIQQPVRSSNSVIKTATGSSGEISETTNSDSEGQNSGWYSPSYLT